MSLHLYVLHAPGNDLDQETYTFHADSREVADERAANCLRDIFGLCSRPTYRLEHVATFKSRESYEKARDVARESGVALTPSDVDVVLDVLLGEELAS